MTARGQTTLEAMLATTALLGFYALLLAAQQGVADHAQHANQQLLTDANAQTCAIIANQLYTQSGGTTFRTTPTCTANGSTLEYKTPYTTGNADSIAPMFRQTRTTALTSLEVKPPDHYG
ncbi:MAG: hypothetical protein Q7R47_01930 [Candidatus Diapherotrites archaeon]|nr:hypothetical protein [Candidatus Diapherotrites archaeon]